MARLGAAASGSDLHVHTAFFIATSALYCQAQALPNRLTARLPHQTQAANPWSSQLGKHAFIKASHGPLIKAKMNPCQ